LKTFSYENGLIVEEYLDGPELSIESFSFAGRHIVFGINMETKFEKNSANPFVEIAHQMPAPVPPEQLKAARDYTVAFLDAVGIADGPSHTELKLTSKGPRIIETHARVGGDFLTDLVRLTTGYDLYDLTLAWPLKLIEGIEAHPIPYGGAAIRYFTPPPGQVTAIRGIETTRGGRGVRTLHLPLHVGDQIRPILKSSDRVGYVIASAVSSTKAADICKHAIDNITIEVNSSST
jgi:hypothetical protein